MTAARLYRPRNSDKEKSADVLQADDRIWNCRRNFAEACRDVDIMFMTEDFVVPLDQIPVILSKVPALEDKHHLYAVTTAHIGDGNLHVCLLNVNSLSPDDWVKTIDAFHQDIFPMIYELGGKISGEHGIGYKKHEEFRQFTQPGEYRMMCAIKHALDPNNIMNPGKVVDL